ncbi:type II toxin-antitoxin system death-on-curing family toxin [Aurantimonas sp. C2-6-R+9]|uniref:type II toxin-antitoxin system death-on-curing family toxin n=1 Tax=unclassified Aurantimonas TaxID=2638230 RepID=UPI002E180A2E|nr:MULTISPECIES: type II toxin-antitoxin system death-on-curing family toxin [unclassified Aurantimonas]MEC5291623.1 type II toxin-antitoxin system death-on-curing family toxin [Aurantimonas sp. C2-3-R2]MEC5322068.1 type II toxin-antitoxin system death-on-curing family toxin [Aurantimonas sp. A3-2-R12]MEC5381763.1 type II toxin-antitoxin system death-on-curing family toxin [Aurantimonas sp. C2-6-R+9]MEC5412707.1 type II toxin-antitoxin system death-on-curing family toxin [Aurantimonas sp. C2-4-
MTIEWLSREVVEAIHYEQLSEHGGLAGIRDENALEAALDRPLNKAAYDEPDLFDLAAAYLYGIARNHPFSDGNKRTAYLAAYVFLDINGYDITADNGMVYQFVMDVAAGAVGEDSAARWFRDFTEKRR